VLLWRILLQDAPRGDWNGGYLRAGTFRLGNASLSDFRVCEVLLREVPMSGPLTETYFRTREFFHGSLQSLEMFVEKLPRSGTLLEHTSKPAPISIGTRLSLRPTSGQPWNFWLENLRTLELLVGKTSKPWNFVLKNFQALELCVEKLPNLGTCGYKTSKPVPISIGARRAPTDVGGGLGTFDWENFQALELPGRKLPNIGTFG